MIEASRFVAPWRAAVTSSALEIAELEGWVKQSGPMSAHMVFHIARPASVKESDRPLPIKPPDLDKLVRAVCDSLTDAHIWEDDAQLVSLTCEKQYVNAGEDGVSIHVKSFEVN